MILRNHFRGTLRPGDWTEVQSLIAKDEMYVRQAVAEEFCLTVALYRHDNMMFLYFEALEEGIEPERLFPHLSRELEFWPERGGKVTWSPMYHIYYHSIPEKVEGWVRKTKKNRRGRIAVLYPEKLFSYVYHHQAIVEEGLLLGDKYQSIALHGNILFSYFEEPRIETNIKKDMRHKSKAIDAWLAADPESHFDHRFSGEGNFKFIEEVFSIGREDL